MQDDQYKALSTEEFKDSFLVEPKPAVVPGGTDNTGNAGAQPGPTVAPADQGPPIIPKEELRQELGEEDDAIEVKKWNKKEITENLEMMLNFRSLLQAELLSWYSGEDSAKYELDEEAMNRLARVYAPLMKKWGGKIPDIFWIALAEGIITLPLLRTAMSDRKINRANAAMAGTDQVHQAASAAATAQAGKRRNFSLDGDGYYLMDAVTNLRLKQAVRQAKPKPSIEDLNRILQDNEESTVRALYPQWFIGNA